MIVKSLRDSSVSTLRSFSKYFVVLIHDGYEMSQQPRALKWKFNRRYKYNEQADQKVILIISCSFPKCFVRVSPQPLVNFFIQSSKPNNELFKNKKKLLWCHIFHVETWDCWKESHFLLFTKLEIRMTWLLIFQDSHLTINFFSVKSACSGKKSRRTFFKCSFLKETKRIFYTSTFTIDIFSQKTWPSKFKKKNL